MPSLNEILENLGITKNPTELTDEEWKQVSKAMSEAQLDSYEKGNRIGMREGLTPEEQARRDRENPNLADPIRGSSEKKG